MLFCYSKLFAGNCVVLDPEKILDVLQGMRLRFLGTCSRACANSLFASQRRITRIGSKLGSFMSACAAIAHPLLLSVKRRS